jgi:hypothetical protein
MTLTKLGLHYYQATPTAVALAESGLAWVQMGENLELIPRFNHTTAQILARPKLTSELLAPSKLFHAGISAKTAAQQFFQNTALQYPAFPEVAYWQAEQNGLCRDIAQMQWQAEFDTEWMRLLADIGCKAVIGNFPTGTPDWAVWQAYAPALQAAQTNGALLGLQEATSPWLWWGTGKFQDEPDLDLHGTGLHTLRYRRVISEVLATYAPQLQLLIVEFALRTADFVLDEENDGSWQSNCQWWQRWQGSTDPLSYWRDLPAKDRADASPEQMQELGAQYYWHQIQWYANELAKDAQVIGAILHGWGCASGEDISQSTIPALWLAETQKGQDAEAIVSTEPLLWRNKGQTDSSAVVKLPALLENPTLQASSAVPDGWSLWQAGNATPHIHQQTQPWAHPTHTRLALPFIPPQSTSAWQVYTQNQPHWWALSQKVQALEVGRRYLWRVQLWCAALTHDSQAVDQPFAAECWLWANFGSQRFEQAFALPDSLQNRRMQNLQIEFTAPATVALLAVEGRMRFNLAWNFWLISGVELLSM